MAPPETKRGPQRDLAVQSRRASEQYGFYKIGRVGARLTARHLRPMVGVRCS